jgi:hypothetical protein
MSEETQLPETELEIEVGELDMEVERRVDDMIEVEVEVEIAGAEEDMTEATLALAEMLLELAASMFMGC